MISASSSFRALSNSRKANKTAVRLANDVARQAGKAALAEATACPTSPASAKDTLADACPVAGANTSPLRPDEPALGLPSTQCATAEVLVAAVGASVLAMASFASGPS